ncbi:DUF4262 domain-containing protein [Pontibacter sp. SGAir0037]|uniref:DUF4262 domain-containing protein n=1 Tax=Pontibacter sp. SGAir0037 TaxID=2571030 RepID=UPI0010CCDEC4|nr:DUF4262 domain-containing protein [Pontibacter sp. SGAir0037]QCR24500.1 hypothetical protein C1N53_20485 [Pontibacter sp. SGAir0037]
MIERSDFLKRIKKNIESDGYHLTFVSGGALPRFAYTIGCKETFGSELIFAGGEFYSQDNISTAIDNMIKELTKGGDWQKMSLGVNSLGSFSLSKVDKSWSKLIALGAFDFYNQEDIHFLQIIPDKQYNTLDIPNMSKVFGITEEPVWQWLVKEWHYPVPYNSTAVTNLKVLYGEKATEVMRWETDEWEIFSGAGPDVPKEDIRTIPLGTILGIDNSLEKVVDLEVGKGLWRDIFELDWNNWG